MHKNIKNCKNNAKIAKMQKLPKKLPQNCQKIAIFLKIAKTRGRENPDGQLWRKHFVPALQVVVETICPCPRLTCCYGDNLSLSREIALPESPIAAYRFYISFVPKVVRLAP